MKHTKTLHFLMVPLVAVLLLASCRKEEEHVEDELQEAGYELTEEGWMRACAEGDARVVRRFLDAGFDVATRNDAGDTGAHAAAATGGDEVAKLLLDRGLEVDVRGESERTPLMAAVLGDQSSMVRWLLRQGADARLRDADGFSPLMLAVREGRAGAVEELASQSQDELDDALLLAALVGQDGVIDTLTSYGASVFARMNDGRTALMLAAENGHLEAAEMLVELGASRFSTSDDGRNAMDYASDAGHPDVQMVIERSSREVAMRLDAEEDLIQNMTDYVDLVAGGATTRGSEGEPAATREPTVLLEDAVVSMWRPSGGDSAAEARPDAGGGAAAVGESGSVRESAPVDEPASAGPPLVMRHYQQRELPLKVMGVDGNTAILEMSGSEIREVRVERGAVIPQTTVEVVRVGTRMERGKLNDGEPIEVAYVEVRDQRGGGNRTWISGEPASTHDPAALVEDAASGRRYLAMPGQRFRSEDGRAFVVSDVRPNQLVIIEEGTGAAHTLPLRGPRG